MTAQEAPTHCQTKVCNRVAVAEVITQTPLCMRCGLLKVNAYEVSAAPHSTSDEPEITMTELGQSVIVLGPGNQRNFTKYADADFYLECKEVAKSNKSLLDEGVVYHGSNDIRELFGKHKGLYSRPAPAYPHSSFFLEYAGVFRHDSRATDDSLLDHIPWPASVVVTLSPCPVRSISLSVWQAAANTLKVLADQLPHASNNRGVKTLEIYLLGLSADLENITEKRLNEDDDDDDDMPGEDELESRLRQGPTDRALLLAHADVTALVTEIQSQKTRIQQEEEEEVLAHAVAKEKLRVRSPLLMVEPYAGITVTDGRVGGICAVLRALVPYWDTVLQDLASVNYDSNTDAYSEVVRILERTLHLSEYPLNVLASLWMHVRETLHVPEDPCSSFVARRPISKFAPPGVLLFEDELAAYPNLDAMRGRSAGFVVHTTFPLVSLAVNPLSDSPGIDVRVTADGSLEVIEYPDWSNEGHWIAATLTVTKSGVWVWTVEDSTSFTDTDEHLQTIRELMIYVLGVIRIRAAEYAHKKSAST